MDVVAKPVQPATPAVIWGEIAAQHTRKEKAAEETKILAMSKKENENGVRKTRPAALDI